MVLFAAPVSAYLPAGESEQQTIHTAEFTNSSIAVTTDGQIKIEGNIANTPFSAIGKLYNIFDGIDCNKIYFIESDTDYETSFCLLNIEFESNAKERNLNLANAHLVGCDVIRIAVYIEGKFYYAEQAYTIDHTIIENVTPLSIASASPEMEAIISNASWYTHVKPRELKADSAANTSPRAIVPVIHPSTPTPIYGESLSQTDTDVITKIGRTKFKEEQFVHGSTSTGGYVLSSVEWPVDSGNIVTSCLYYEIIGNAPTIDDEAAVIEVELIVNREYIYIESTDTLELNKLGTSYRMYDVKLALACAQTSANNGYDYIYEQRTSLYTNEDVNVPLEIAQAVVMQFDKYGVLAVTDAIINAFSPSQAVSGTTYCTWPYDYNTHYQSISHGKRANTMLRAIRIDTDGYLLNEEGTYINLAAEVADCDYENSSTNISMTKAIKYAFSFNLRSKGWTWVGGGIDEGVVAYESYKEYTK